METQVNSELKRSALADNLSGNSTLGESSGMFIPKGKVTSTFVQSDDRNAVTKESFMELANFKNRWKEAVREDKCWVDPFPYAT